MVASLSCVAAGSHQNFVCSFSFQTKRAPEGSIGNIPYTSDTPAYHTIFMNIKFTYKFGIENVKGVMMDVEFETESLKFVCT
jgi:hypothetical protein